MMDEEKKNPNPGEADKGGSPDDILFGPIEPKPETPFPVEQDITAVSRWVASQPDSENQWRALFDLLLNKYCPAN